MNLSIQQLLQLQDVDSEKFLLEEELRLRPLEVEDERKKANETQKVTEALTSQIRQLRVESDRREMDVKKADSEIEKYKIALNQSKSNQEYTILKEQIKRQEDLREKAEEEVLEQLTRIDGLEAERKTLNQRLAVEQQALAKKSAEVAEIVQGLGAQVAKLLERRKEIAVDIDKDHLKMYERVLGRHRNYALARVEGQVCQGCYISVTAQDVNLLLQGQFVQCRSCSRLLYLDQ